MPGGGACGAGTTNATHDDDRECDCDDDRDYDYDRGYDHDDYDDRDYGYEHDLDGDPDRDYDYDYEQDHDRARDRHPMTESWTTLKLIAWTQEFLAKKGVDAPRLTAELLLAHALSCDRVRLYLDFDKPLGEPELARYRDLVRRRADGEPTAYLVGKKEFFGRTFQVDARVLVPRPETELLVEAALAALPEGGRALDLCTGSGCIAVSLALERKGARVVATDASEDALAAARENARRLGAVVEFAAGDLWAAVHGPERFDVVVSNPPYIPAKELAGLPREVRREPCIALDGGEDGLSVLRRIVEGAPAWLSSRGVLAVEMHESHAEVLPALCRAAGFASARARKDLAGLPRLVVAAMAEGDPPA